jgi:phosphate transport system substrate-binding protein
VGTAKSISWPASSSVGGKGNEGVAGLVTQTPGAIGYVELAYLLANNMTYAQLRNASGQYVSPTLDTVAAAAAKKPHVSATSFAIVNEPGADSYPISGYSWALLAKKPSDPARGAILKKLFLWTVTKGQADAASIGYVPLPHNIQEAAVKDIKEMETN